jgi:nucleoid DNA-binding protein
MITAPPRKLVSTVAKETGIRRSAVQAVLVAVFEQIKNEAANGSIMIRGFGTFHTATRAGCTRPSPSDTTKIIEVPPTKRLALRSPADRLGDEDHAP